MVSYVIGQSLIASALGKCFPNLRKEGRERENAKDDREKLWTGPLALPRLIKLLDLTLSSLSIKKYKCRF